MNQSAQGVINCPHCECSIRIEGTLKKIQFAVQIVKKLLMMLSLANSLASTIDLLPSKRPDSKMGISKL